MSISAEKGEAGYASPVSGVVTSSFGNRRNPATNEMELHNGVDVAAPVGTPVAAVSDGTVEEAGEDAYSGIFVRYVTTDGMAVTYAHLNEVMVENGQTVQKGEVIAKSGNTGISSGPHAHITFRRDGKLVDPADYLAFDE